MSLQVSWVNGLLPTRADRPLGGQTRVFLPVAIDEVHGAIGQSSPGKCRNGFDYIPKFPLLTPHLLDTDLIQRQKHSQGSGRAQRAEPGSLVVGRGDGEIQECAGLVPHTAVIAGSDAEAVVAGSKIGIERLPAVPPVPPIAIPACPPCAQQDPPPPGVTERSD